MTAEKDLRFADLSALPRGRYKTVIADPPWPEKGGGVIKRGADRHYPLMSIAEIAALPIAAVAAANAHLYLWVTNNYLPSGIECVKAWGFRYVTLVTWAKEGQVGIGQYFRGKTEHVIFAVRGSLPYRTYVKPDGQPGRLQGATLIQAKRGAHSEKPQEIMAMAERVSYEPRLEMFARKSREGWDCYGNQVDHHAPLFADAGLGQEQVRL